MAQEYINRRLVKDSYFGSHKGNVKTVMGNSSNLKLTRRMRQGHAFLFCHHKEQQFHRIMSEDYPNGPHLNKKTIVIQKKIHGCSENSV